MDDCAVCYEAVSAATGHCTLSCKHSFHIACLTRWSTENPSCPMCRNPLGVTEAPAKQLTFTWNMENVSRSRILTSTPRQGPQSIMRELIQQALGPEPVQPPPPPRAAPNTRIIHIGEGVSVSEGDVALVMEQSAVTRGEAVRALRRYEGDIVNSIIMLTSPDAVTPRPPVVRDPMQECSDDQATAWFLQELFDDTIYAWNSYSDMIYRMRNNTHRHEYWMHREFQLMETRIKVDAGYESA